MGEQVAASIYGGVAQLGEHLPCKQGVKSSNLSISICTVTMIRADMYLENRIQNNYPINFKIYQQDIRGDYP